MCFCNLNIKVSESQSYDMDNVNPLLKEENVTGFRSNDSCLECK